MPPNDNESESTSQPSNRRPLVPVLAALCAGIALDRCVAIPLSLWWLAGLGSLALWALLCGWDHYQLTAGSLLVAVASAGGAWQALDWRYFCAEEIGRYADDQSQPFCLEAVASGAPVRAPARPPDPLRAIPSFDQTRLQARLLGVRDGSQWKRAAGNVTITVDGHL